MIWNEIIKNQVLQSITKIKVLNVDNWLKSVPECKKNRIFKEL